jgi:hypothetical protein
MSRRTLKEAFEAGYKAGFMNSGEGYNGEYPFAQKGEDPECEEHWADSRKVAWEDYENE